MVFLKKRNDRNQKLTQEWWSTRKDDFDLVISEFVSREAAAGDPEEISLPERAKLDALHIAIATVHGVDYLLTWNCTHINNAELRLKIKALCRLQGCEPPIFCTPQKLH